MITAQQVNYVVVQLPVPSKVFLFLVNVWRGRFPCNVAAHCVAEAFIWLKACVFSRVLSESLSSARPSTATISPKHGQQRRTLVDSTLWRAPPPYFPSYLLTKQRMAQSGRRSAPPLSSFERWCERRRLKKFQHTPADRKGHLFHFWCSVPRTLKFKKAPLHCFRRPCHHLKVALPWFLSALQFSIIVSCNLQAEASVTGRGRGRAAVWSISKEVFLYFFIWYFRKKLRARVMRNKENNNSGLTCKDNFHVALVCRQLEMVRLTDITDFISLGRSPTSSNAAALIFRVSVLIFEAKSHLHFYFALTQQR